MTLTLLLLSFLLLPLQRTGEQAMVNITLVDVFGHPVSENVTSEFKLTNRKNRRDTFTTKELTFRDIPFGEYDLDVLAGRGFASARRIIQVDTKDVWVMMSLPTASVESGAGREVLGTVRGISRDGLRWVKLVSIYSDFVRETRLDVQGRFRFVSVPSGGYALIILKDGRACDMRMVEITAIPQSVDINLGDANPCK